MARSAPRGGTKARRPRRIGLRAALWTAAVVSLLAVATEVAAGVWLTPRVRARAVAILHGPVSIRAVAVSFLRMRADAVGVRVPQPEGGAAYRDAPPLLEASRIGVVMGPRAAVAAGVRIERLDIVAPRIAYVLDEQGVSSVAAAWERAMGTGERTAGSRDTFWVQRARVREGVVDLIDHDLDGGHVARLRIEDLALDLDGVTDYAREMPADPRRRNARVIDWCGRMGGGGRLAGAHGRPSLALSGRFAPLAGKLDLELEAQIPGIDARDLAAYAVPVFSVVPRRGTVDMTLEVVVRADRFESSYLRFSTHGFQADEHPLDPAIARNVLQEMERVGGNLREQCQVRGHVSEPRIVSMGPLLKIGLRRLPGGVVRAPWRIVRWMFGAGGGEPEEGEAEEGGTQEGEAEGAEGTGPEGGEEGP